MIKCRKCNLTKPEIEFSVRAGKYTQDCLVCKRAYNRANYKARDPNSKQARLDQISTRKRNIRKLLWDYKKKEHCAECGETDTVVLDFDHLDRTTKEDEICAMVKAGASWDKILKEIAKCQILCANCHRRKTAKQLGWYVGE